MGLESVRLPGDEARRIEAAGAARPAQGSRALTDVGCDPVAARAVMTALTAAGALADADGVVDRLCRYPTCAETWLANPVS